MKACENCGSRKCKGCAPKPFRIADHPHVPLDPSGSYAWAPDALRDLMRSQDAKFGEVLSTAELAVSAALTIAPVHGLDEDGAAEAELVRAALSLARTLVSAVKAMRAGGRVNKAGFVQGTGSQIDTLCAELATLRRIGKQS